MTPLPEPPHTHSHPDNVCSASLATLANGLRASSRYTTSTPFKYITAAEATKGLPAAIPWRTDLHKRMRQGLHSSGTGRYLQLGR